MDMTRREFLGVTAAAALPPPLLPFPSSAAAPPTPPWLVIPGNGQCSLPESAPGFHAALDDQGPKLGAFMVIVPALLELAPRLAGTIVRFLRNGITVIVESGAGFAGHLSFRQHRRSLRESLQLDVRAPVALWTDDSRSRRGLYVDYTWPHPAKIRDFSRVVPVGDQPGEVIAWVDGMPVALKRRVDAGTLIFLGSPLGPALWAGDLQARRWLDAVALAA